MDNSLNNKSEVQLLSLCWYLIGAVLVVRLLSLASYPFFDTTESRYGEIARIMFETGNWITPQFDYNVPFWGKPPLHTWMTAMGFSVLGVSEFAGRLPHFLISLGTLYLVYRFVVSLIGRLSAITAVLVLSSSLGFILASGMVMTDSALLFAYTLAMVSFWQCYQLNSPNWYGHLFFVALGLGMLIKGPVLVVLVGIALFSWSLWQRRFMKALKSLPWLTGLALFSFVTLPWYLLAESATPGFLEYFIVGEHFNRFLVSGWEGDLYGSAHTRPRGSIWLFWILCASPWSIWLLKRLVDRVIGRGHRAHINTTKGTNGITPYLIGWMLAPLVLFTFAGNILPIYVLPGFAAMAVLFALHIELSKKVLYSACVTLLLLIVLVVGINSNWLEPKTEAPLLQQTPKSSLDSEVYYFKTRPFSAQFYSNGQAQVIETTSELQDKLRASKAFYLGLAVSDYRFLTMLLQDSCEVTAARGKRIMLGCFVKKK